MLFSDIVPFIRFAHVINLTRKSVYTEVVPLDARLFFVLDGCGKIIVAGKEYKLKKDSVLVINSGIPYKLCTPKESISYTAINFDYDKRAVKKKSPVVPVAVKDFSPDLLLNHVQFQDVKNLSSVLFIENLPTIRKKLSTIVNEYALQFAYFQEKLSALLVECLIECVRAERLITQAFENQTISEIIRYIHENYNQSLTNTSIGLIFNYHPNYINQLIKSVTGMSLHKYLIHVRLVNALSLLKDTELSINEIALACGFCDSAYFSGYFKKEFKTCPSKFRKV